jgi:hypothetical protein
MSTCPHVHMSTCPHVDMDMEAVPTRARTRCRRTQVWPWAVEEKLWAGGIPKEVPWISGVIAPADAEIVSAPADDRWRKRWCDKHGATYGACDGPEAS